MGRKRKEKQKRKSERPSKAEAAVTAREQSNFAFTLAVLAGFAFLIAAISIGVIRRNAPTYDESYQLLAGYSHVKWGDFRVYPEHPPLGKILTGLPLAALDIKDPRPTAPYWSTLAERYPMAWGMANQMIFRENDTEKILLY